MRPSAPSRRPTPTFPPRPRVRLARHSPILLLALMLLGPLGGAAPARAQTGVSFSKFFSPDTMGPGSVSTLTFEVNSERSTPTTDLAFTDTLPGALTIAEPAFVSNTCGGTLTAPEGGSTIELSGGAVGAFSTCQITVDVTGTSLGSHQNVSGDLTSSAGNSGPATATLTIAGDRPGFSKSFSPDMARLGETVRLTFTIDNSANPEPEGSMAFTDNLPSGLEIASPANTANTCGGTLSAPAGGSTITLSGGFVAAESSCTIALDVTATAVGELDNRTTDLLSSAGNSGKASDSLTVVVDELALVKSFVDDPAFPGGTTTLEFSLTNLNRSQTATGVTFTDDLDATLSGLVAIPPLPADPCGAGSTLTGTSLLTLTGGTLGPGETCTFQVTLQVPAGASPGSFPNTTSTVTATVDGNTVTGAPATDTLAVDVYPVLTKTFLSSSVGAGGTVDVELTITNTSSSFGASNITFTDDLNAFLPGTTVETTTPLSACGGSVTSLSGALQLSSGTLGPGGSCDFTVTLDIPAGTPTGTYTNTTSEITATVDGSTRTGPSATDTLDVVGAPAIAKELIDDPVDPGGTVTLEFTLTHGELAGGDATAIAFTDDLDATLSGLVAVGLPQTDVCGAGSSISGTSSLSFTGGTLAPGESCTFPVTLQVPLDAPPGFHTNTTSAVTATVDGIATTGRSASDDLLISGPELTKQFIGDPALPGSTVILRFTITNDNPDFDATDISFTDELDDALPGLAATGLPQSDVCGMGSSISGTSNLVFAGGSVPASSSCTFDVTVQVPAGAASSTYFNTTSPLVATLDGQVITFDNARDDLIVDANLLDLSKEFTNDPAVPGGTVTLQFSITNLSGTETITDIAFTDDLDATLSGLVSESGTQMDVCGAGSQLAGTSVLSLTGGSLGPGETCTFSATLRLPDTIASGGTILNTTSMPTGSAGGIAVEGAPASDDLLINLLGFSKAFDGPTAAGGDAVLTFTIENLSTTTAATDLDFNDDLDAVVPGLVATDTPRNGVCGFGSQLAGTSLLTLTGGSLGPGESCTVSVALAVPDDAAPGSYLNTSSELLQNGLPVAAPATDTLEIEPPPAFGKVFSPNLLALGGTSTLTFTIDNTASVLDASGLAFTDDLPAGIVVAATPSSSTGCGGTLTATAGAGIISLSGGSVGAGATCTVQVDVTGTAEGTFVNTSGALSSSLGSSGTATDTIDVVADDFVAGKSFRTTPVLPGGLVEMELSIVNGSSFPLTDLALTDDLGAVLPGLAAEGLPLTDVCGAGSQVSGTSVVSLTGGSLAPGGSCTIVVPVRVPADASSGTFTNITSTVTGQREGLPVEADPALADLTVAFVDFTKSFAPTEASPGSTVQLTFELVNPDPAHGIDDLSFTDDLDAALPGLTATDTPLTDPCGAGSQLTGTEVLTLSGGSLGPGGSCTFSVTVRIPGSSPGGTFENVTGPLSGTVDGAAVSGGAASAARAPLRVLGVLEIPTLSEWMLLLLGSLMAALGVWCLRM